jgi:hypothetical protein
VGDDDEAEQVNGYGPLGSFGVEMPTEMAGGEMAQYVTYYEGGGGGGGGGGGFYACG